MVRIKQKAIVDKYFVKTHRKYGMCSNFFECKFCKKCYAFNSYRLAKHLLTCTKTGAEFASEKLYIETLITPTTKPKPRPVPASVPIDHQEKKLNYDKLLDNIKLVYENQISALIPSGTFKLTESCTADNSTSKLTTNVLGHHSNTSFVSTTTQSNYTSENTEEQVIHCYIVIVIIIDLYIHGKKYCH